MGSGICLGIWFVRPGCSITAFRWPKKAPTRVRGKEIPNHITTNARNVPNGMAFEEFFDQTNRFTRKTIDIKSPGTSVAVKMAFLVQEVPLKTL